MLNWKKYFAVFVITSVIFSTALYVSNRLNERRLNEIRAIGDNISIDLLSSETQFALLQETSCAYISQSILSKELSAIERRVAYAEENLSGGSEELTQLKKNYSLRPPNARPIALDLGRGANTMFYRITKVTARTRVH